LKKTIQPVLIIGTQRSGSNLLRLMLNQLPEIEAPHPPHILQVFFPLLAANGNLEEGNNFKMLVEDVIRYVEVNPVPWIKMNFNRDEILQRCQRKSLVELFKVINQVKAELKGADYWCCKSMGNVYFIPAIEQAGLKPYYIYLLRDGRDVAASFKKTIVGEKHIYFIARNWTMEQELAISMTEKYAKERTEMLRYEEFIANPKKALLPVLNMLGLQWSDTILEYYLSEEAKHTAASGEMWRNVVKPVDPTNMKHYSEKLSKEEILIFEKVAGSMLQQLGYKLENKHADLVDDFTDKQIALFRLENEKAKKEARLKYPKDAALRVPQETIVSEIKQRISKEALITPK
jgi:hypothetical protein